MSRTAATPSAGSAFTIPAIVVTVATDAGVPVLAVAGVACALVAAKRARRRRRKSVGPPAARIAGAWLELLDLSRDLGIAFRQADADGAADASHARTVSVPAGGRLTRREFAAYAEGRGLPSARAVAVAADAATFGPADPDSAAVAQVWQLVAAARRGATARLPRWRRAWVAVNPASLWASRAAVDQAVALARRAVRVSATPGRAGSRGGGYRGPGGHRGAGGSHGSRGRRGGQAIAGGAYR